MELGPHAVGQTGFPGKFRPVSQLGTDPRAGRGVSAGSGLLCALMGKRHGASAAARSKTGRECGDRHLGRSAPPRHRPRNPPCRSFVRLGAGSREKAGFRQPDRPWAHASAARSNGCRKGAGHQHTEAAFGRIASHGTAAAGRSIPAACRGILAKRALFRRRPRRHNRRSLCIAADQASDCRVGQYCSCGVPSRQRDREAAGPPRRTNRTFAWFSNDRSRYRQFRRRSAGPLSKMRI